MSETISNLTSSMRTSENSNVETVSSSGARHEDELAEFRARWRSELRERVVLVAEGRGRHDGTAAESPFASDPCKVIDKADKESDAKALFLQGVWAEQHGFFYEATGYYRQAIKLVPDIEDRIESNLPARTEQDTGRAVGDVGSSSSISAGDSAAIELVRHFSELRLQENKKESCQPHRTSLTSSHISSLPAEVLLYILKWVVSSELDLRSLEQFSQVCTGFYMLARDDELWRTACIKVWGVRCRLVPSYSSWRDMYISEPHLLFNGCYISKTSYARQGERSLDQFYRPWHVIDYYRYCRFFPDGTMLLYTSADDIATTVTKLRNRRPRLQGLLAGAFHFNANQRVQCVLKRLKGHDTGRSRRRGHLGSTNPADEETFHLELLLKEKHGKKNASLSWEKYSILTRRCGGEETLSVFALNPKDYPPLSFARVKSFTAEATAPLH